MTQGNTSDLTSEAWRYIAYLSFKMDCAMEQEQVMWRFDKAAAERHLKTLTAAKLVKTDELQKVMPRKALTRVVDMPKVMFNKPDIKVHSKPEKMFKADGSPTAVNLKWYKLLEEQGLPEYTEGPIEVLTGPPEGSPSANNLKWHQVLKQQGLPEDTKGPITLVTGYEDGSPTSHQQVKDWLFGIGWKPKAFDLKRNKDTGETRKVPQVRVEGELCPSVLKLVSKDPAVAVLDGLTVITHRMSFFQSMLNNHITDDNGVHYLKAEVAGLTNTLRFKHSKPLANLPSVGKPWGEEIRGCLLAKDDDHVLCGWDMVSLESNTKKHYMYPHDPVYVEELSQEGFDEHLDLAKQAGYITQEDIDGYNAGTRPDIKPVRNKFKPVNYSAVYGISAGGIVRDTGMKMVEAEALLKAYWERNHAVLKVTNEIFTKQTKDRKLWLMNPVSGFWYSLRYKKDIWSTTNQGTGVYCFDRMLNIVRKEGIKFSGQFHDEGAYSLPKGNEEGNDEMLRGCVKLLNEQLELNVSLDIDSDYGNSYAAVH